MRITKTITLDEADIRMAVAAWFPDGVLPENVKLECKDGAITTRGFHVMQAVIATQEEQSSPATPEPEKPAYPKRSEVQMSQNDDSLDTLREAEKRGNNYYQSGSLIYWLNGEFCCMKEELQDG